MMVPNGCILDGSRRDGWVATVGSTKRFRRVPLQIELETKQDADSLEGDPDSVPWVRIHGCTHAAGVKQK
jgi:hypothetical protein